MSFTPGATTDLCRTPMGKRYSPALFAIGSLAGVVILNLVLRFPAALSLAYVGPVMLATRRGGLRNGVPTLAITLPALTLSLAMGGLMTRHDLFTNVVLSAIELTGAMILAEAVRVEHLRTVQRSNSDDLTGAGTRQAVTELGQRALNRAILAGHPVVVGVIDVDKFKQLNDRHGHAMGDAVLVDLVKTLRSSLGRADIVGRTGGDEFLVVLPQRTLEDAESILLKALHRFEDKTLVHGYGCSFSYGLSTPGQDGCSWSGLLDAADQDMYRRKAQKSQQSELRLAVQS